MIVYSSQYITDLLYKGKSIPHRKIGITHTTLNARFAKYSTYELERLTPKFSIDFGYVGDKSLEIDNALHELFAENSVQIGNSRSTELYDCDDNVVKI